jgi:hypothetical protein
MAFRYDYSMVELAARRYSQNRTRARFSTAVKVMAVLLFGGLGIGNLEQGKVGPLAVVLIAFAILGMYLLTVDIRASRRAVTQ